MPAERSTQLEWCLRILHRRHEQSGDRIDVECGSELARILGRAELPCEEVVERGIAGDLRRDRGAGGCADDQVRVQHFDAFVLEAGEHTELPCDAGHAAATEDQCP